MALPLSIKLKLPFISFITTSNIGKKGFLNKQNIYELYKNDFYRSHSHQHLRIKTNVLKNGEKMFINQNVFWKILFRKNRFFSFFMGNIR